MRGWTTGWDAGSDSAAWHSSLAAVATWADDRAGVHWHQAQQFVHDALVNGYRIGKGHPVPNRMFWAGQPQ
jgi:hypothetical protein